MCRKAARLQRGLKIQKQQIVGPSNEIGYDYVRLIAPVCAKTKLQLGDVQAHSYLCNKKPLWICFFSLQNHQSVKSPAYIPLISRTRREIHARAILPLGQNCTKIYFKKNVYIIFVPNLSRDVRWGNLHNNWETSRIFIDVSLTMYTAAITA